MQHEYEDILLPCHSLWTCNLHIPHSPSQIDFNSFPRSDDRSHRQPQVDLHVLNIPHAFPDCHPQKIAPMKLLQGHKSKQLDSKIHRLVLRLHTLGLFCLRHKVPGQGHIGKENPSKRRSITCKGRPIQIFCVHCMH